MKGQDSSSHPILGLPYDRQTSSQRLTLSSPPDLCVILCHEANDVVEIVSADLRLSFRMVLEARWAAKVHRATYDEVPSIVAHLPKEIFRRHCFAYAALDACCWWRVISGQPLDTRALSKSVCWKFSRCPLADLFSPQARIRLAVISFPFFFSHFFTSIVSQWQIWPSCCLPSILFGVLRHVIV